VEARSCSSRSTYCWQSFLRTRTTSPDRAHAPTPNQPPANHAPPTQPPTNHTQPITPTPTQQHQQPLPPPPPENGSLDEMLDSEEHLSDQLESLPYLCRFQYDKSSQYITSLMDPLVQQYEEVRGGGLHGVCMGAWGVAWVHGVLHASCMGACMGACMGVCMGVCLRCSSC